MIPDDPVMLLSYINTKLRDEYDSLELLCEDLNYDQQFLTEKLSMIDYHYDAVTNQFK